MPSHTSTSRPSDPKDLAITTEYDSGLLERARRVRLLALDVDGVLTDGRLYYDHTGHEMKAFHVRDGLGMKSLQRHGVRLAIITGRTSPVVAQRARELGVDFVHQGRDDKLHAFRELLDAAEVEEQAVCYAGDDWLDIPVLDRVGLAVTVADADTLVKGRVHWVTTRPGGHGAVREICDLVLHAQGHDRAVLAAILGQ